MHELGELNLRKLLYEQTDVIPDSATAASSCSCGDSLEYFAGTRPNRSCLSWGPFNGSVDGPMSRHYSYLHGPCDYDYCDPAEGGCLSLGIRPDERFWSHSSCGSYCSSSG